MVQKICEYLLKQMRRNMSEIDDEKAEVIKYGLELIIGEIPKIIILFGIAFLLGIGKLVVFTYLALMPYRATSGGFHLKTHVGCILGTSAFYYSIVFLSKYIVLQDVYKVVLAICVGILGVIIISLYAPADTENLPIISKKERKLKRNLSYLFLAIMLILSIVIKNNTLSNILLWSSLVQTISISKLAYIITNNKYGHILYEDEFTS